MIFKPLPLKDAYLITLESHADNRGHFARIFCKREFESIGFRKEIVQVNHSITIRKGAVRGMHFQYPPKAEFKMVRCIRGSVFDVLIDLRRGSPTFLCWHGETLSSDNMNMMYIPEGFAHGFQTLEENSELLYFHSEFYSPEYESGIRFDDPEIGIIWPVEITDISERDGKHPLLDNEFYGIEVLNEV